MAKFKFGIPRKIRWTRAISAQDFRLQVFGSCKKNKTRDGGQLALSTQMITQ